MSISNNKTRKKRSLYKKAVKMQDNCNKTLHIPLKDRKGIMKIVAASEKN